MRRNDRCLRGVNMPEWQFIQVRKIPGVYEIPKLGGSHCSGIGGSISNGIRGSHCSGIYTCPQDAALTGSHEDTFVNKYRLLDWLVPQDLFSGIGR